MERQRVKRKGMLESKSINISYPNDSLTVEGYVVVKKFE